MFTCLETSQNSSRSCVKESSSPVSPQGDIWSARYVNSPLCDEHVRRTWSHSQGMPEGCVWAGHERNCVLTKRDRCPAPRLHFLALLFHSDKRHIAHAYCLGHLYLRATSAATIVHAQNSPMVSQGTAKHYHYFLLQGGHQSSPFCPWTELSFAPMSITFSSFCVRFISFIKRY